MRIISEIPSVSHPGYVHPPGTEATLSLHPGGHFRVLELTVPARELEEGWTEQFLLPRGMKVDPSKPVLLRQASAGEWSEAQIAQELAPWPADVKRTANFVVDAEGRIVGVGIAVDDGRFRVFELGAGFVDEKGTPV